MQCYYTGYSWNYDAGITSFHFHLIIFIQTTFNHFVCAGMFPIEVTLFWLMNIRLENPTAHQMWVRTSYMDDGCLSVCKRGMTRYMILVCTHLKYSVSRGCSWSEWLFGFCTQLRTVFKKLREIIYIMSHVGIYEGWRRRNFKWYTMSPR